MPLRESGILRFLSGVRSLMTIGRFSVYKCHLREDVAQHSYLTTLYAMVLADLESRSEKSVNVEKLLRMCVLHDIEESLTGDVHHPFKHQDRDFTARIDSRAIKWFEKSMDGLPDRLKSEYVALRKASRDESSESQILRAADKLEAMMWVHDELKLGNQYIREAKIMEDIISKASRLDVKSFHELIDLLKHRASHSKLASWSSR